MQEINNEFYQAFCDKFYDVENKCTNDLIVKAILYSNNKGIEITLRNGNKFLLNATRINQN